MHHFLKSPKLLEIIRQTDYIYRRVYQKCKLHDPKRKAFYAVGVQVDEGGGIEIMFHFADISINSTLLLLY